MKHLKLFFALFAMLALGVGNAWGETATLSISSSGVTADKTLTDDGGNSWSVTSDGSYTSNTKYIQVGTNKKNVTYLKLSTSAFSSKNISKIQVWATSKASTNVTAKVYIGGNLLGTSSAYTAQNAAEGGTEYSVANTNNYTGDILIEISRPTAATGAIYFNKAIVTYTEGGSTQPTLSSIEISGDLTKKTYEEGEELDLAGLTVTAKYDDKSEEDVTKDVEWSYTPNPLTKGTTSVDVTATYEDKTATKTINGLTVNEHIVTPGAYDITLNNVFFGTTASANITGPVTGKQNDITITINGTGSTKPRTDATYTRFYASSTMAISVPSGYVIKSIAITKNESDYAAPSVNVGTFDASTKTWTGTANSVTMSFSAKSFINSIKVTYVADVKYALNITTPSNGTGTLVVKDGENVLTSGAEIYEGTKLTVTTTPETGYKEGVVVVVKNASDEDVTADVYDAGTLTMPAYAVTISATFDKKECTLLATPTVSATTTYNSATLSWGAVTKAAKYSVKIGDKEAVETTATSYEVTDLNAETTYTYQVQAIAEAGQDTYCDSEVAEVTFTTTAAPTAKLTLKDIVGTTTQTGALNSTITLPTTAAECSKTFVGWDADENCDHDPTYARGAEYTLAAETQILYAVYADVEGGEPTWNRVTNLAALTSGGTFILGYEATAKSGKIIPMRTSGTATTSTAGYMYSGNADGTTSNNATLDMASISESSKFEIVLEASSIVDGAVNIKLGDNYLGNTDTKNNCKLFTSASKNTAFTPTIGTNDVVKLTIKANADYTTLQFNNNSGSYRYAVYGGAQKDVVFYKKEITLSYSNYSTTCATAPIVTVTPETVTANATGAEGKVTVTYENVNTANVAVALFNDAACTEAFTAGWLNAALDGDKNVTYTVAENTTYAERKAYIKLTAPETTGSTEPAVVVIPVTQAAKEKVFASLAELVAADLTAGDEVTVTLNNDVIKEFYIYSSKRCGVVFDVQKDGKDIKVYFNSQTTIDDWAVGGKLSGTLTNVKWTTYSSAWLLAPANTWAWANLTYTEPKAVSTVVVSGDPTKTTYVDGEAFDPAGLTVTVNYNDATSEVNPTGVTFAVTPATLVKGQTSVSVTATYNSVTSAAYEVPGLTVNDIPTKTVAEFIEAGGTRCYLEGIVSGLTEGNSMKYGNFDLTDASGTIYVYGCLNATGESQKFAELGVKNGDKIKVIADEYELYGGTKDEAKNVQYVSHVSAASITVENITMEVEEVTTITATVDPVDAVVTYTIKENAANAISLSGNTITALKEGTATITATVAEGATYLGNSVDFTVTVGPKTESEEVVILAELDGKWYAMKGEKASGTGQMAALEVTYFNGTLYNVADADKASITWTRTVVGDKVTFANNGKYLKGTSGDTNLALDGSKCEWTFNGTTYTIGNRTFLYRENFNFKNYSTEKANASDVQGNYSALPVVTAPVYVTGDIVYTRTVTNGNYGTICLPYASSSHTGAEFYEVSWLKEGTGLYLDQLEADAQLVAGTPYIFRATSTEIKVTCTGDAVAAPVDGANGLTGTFTDIATGDAALVGNYIIADNQIWVAGAGNSLPANRAYINKDDVPTTEQAKLPGRRRVCMGENQTTGLDNITNGENTTIKVIENGQLIIIRNGEKFNAQGQRL